MKDIIIGGPATCPHCHRQMPLIDLRDHERHCDANPYASNREPKGGLAHGGVIPLVSNLIGERNDEGTKIPEGWFLLPSHEVTRKGDRFLWMGSWITVRVSTGHPVTGADKVIRKVLTVEALNRMPVAERSKK